MTQGLGGFLLAGGGGCGEGTGCTAVTSPGFK